MQTAFLIMLDNMCLVSLASGPKPSKAAFVFSFAESGEASCAVLSF